MNQCSELSWLVSNGYNPDDDLTALRVPSHKGSDTSGGVARTAMHDACYDGRLDVILWLCENGAESTLSVKDGISRGPLGYACVNAQLGVVRWFFKNGLVRDIGAPVQFFLDHPPMTLLDLALLRPTKHQWPEHSKTAAFLILHGAANCFMGHVDIAILRQICPIEYPGMLGIFQRTVAANYVFVSTLLAATGIPSSTTHFKVPKQTHPRCQLFRLQGFEDAVLQLVADFAGVVFGRELRIAREALRCLTQLHCEAEGIRLMEIK
jgi:hypothetical protein